MLMSLRGFHVVPLWGISLGSGAPIHPSSTALSLSGVFRGAGASPICLGVRGALCPGQVVSSSQGKNIETDNHPHSCSHQRSVRSHQLAPKCMSLNWEEAREPDENPCGHGKNMYTEKPLAPGDLNQETSCCDAWSAAYTVKWGLHYHKVTYPVYSVGHFYFWKWGFSL